MFLHLKRIVYFIVHWRSRGLSRKWLQKFVSPKLKFKQKRLINELQNANAKNIILHSWEPECYEISTFRFSHEFRQFSGNMLIKDPLQILNWLYVFDIWVNFVYIWVNVVYLLLNFSQFKLFKYIQLIYSLFCLLMMFSL